MFKTLNIVEVTALLKLAEKELKRLKDAGATVEPGNHPFNVHVKADGNLSRGADTKVTPTFNLERYIKALLLTYASNLGPKESAAWIQALMDTNGALGAVIQLGADTVLRSVDPNLVAIWDSAEAEAKIKFQKVSPKVDRAGNTVVAGALRNQSLEHSPIDWATVNQDLFAPPEPVEAPEPIKSPVVARKKKSPKS